MPRVRWVGHRQRLRHQTDYDGYGVYDANGQPVLEVDYTYENMREVPWIGFTQRQVTPAELPGLSKVYTWGPGEGTFTVEMSDPDWALLQGAWDNCPYPLPFIEVGEDDDGGRIATATRAVGLART